jgi:hypothetical protein
MLYNLKLFHLTTAPAYVHQKMLLLDQVFPDDHHQVLLLPLLESVLPDSHQLVQTEDLECRQDLQDRR